MGKMNEVWKLLNSPFGQNTLIVMYEKCGFSLIIVETIDTSATSDTNDTSDTNAAGKLHV
jgi:hypothetical protein